jgi:16S rRNA (cytosine967-C5)-methyltransferase
VRQGRRAPDPRAEVQGLAARRAAARAVDGVLRRRRPLDESFEADRDLSRLEERDRAFARSLARTTLERLGQILVTLDGHLRSGLPNRAGALEAVLACGAAQLLFMDVPDHAAVDLAVRLVHEDAEAERYAALANAVLRGIGRDKTVAAGPEANLPEWLGERWSANYGPEATVAIANALVAPPPLDLTAKSDAKGWAKRLGGALLPTGTIRLAEHHGPVTALDGFAEGAWWVQDAGAMLPVLALGEVKKRRVLDLCAAPGGKTAALAARGARVTALDRRPERMARLAANLDRLKLKAETLVRDAHDYRPHEPFDAVLLDAPCTTTGTIRRHPDVAWIKRLEDVAALARVQRGLLDHAAGLVAPGGRLVYATCSLEPEEGERQADDFLARDAAFRAEPIGPSEIGGLAELIDAGGRIRSRPDQLAELGGIDGFFVARFVRA